VKLSGSCHCGGVSFSVDSHTPYPFMRCYCSICRKTQGGGGYAVNIMGDAPTLKVRGMRNVSVYRAKLGSPRAQPRKRSEARRHFCAKCGSALWVADPRWPQWVYPFASAIDTPLPTPPGHVELMLDFAAPWAEVGRGRKYTKFGRYPEESIEEWHARRGLTVD
jgi:hypothetical protein